MEVTIRCGGCGEELPSVVEGFTIEAYKAAVFLAITDHICPGVANNYSLELRGNTYRADTDPKDSTNLFIYLV